METYDSSQQIAQLLGSKSPLSSDLTLKEFGHYVALSEEAASLPRGDSTRRSIERHMQTFEGPTALQVGLKTLFGLGLVGALGYVTVSQGMSALDHFHQSDVALGDIQNTFHHLTIFNVPDSAQKVVHDLTAARDNTSLALAASAKAALGATAETGAIALRPWKRPRRRGPFF